MIRQVIKTLEGRRWEDGMSFGLRLSDLRRKKGESLQQVADAVGVSKAHIWEMEKGRADNPSVALVSRLAEHYGTTVAFLVGEERADADPELQHMFRQATKLDPRERALLSDMMKSLLANRKARRA
jgi:transcriptional regulator with XRE-family HTH domain